MQRVFDIIISILVLIIFSPIFLLLMILIPLESKGSPFYIQKRVGKDGKEFNLIKFRSMYLNSDKKGLLTVGSSDRRITRIGKFIRKYKIDELPQFINVLIGDMSIVGPRPEVKKYVDLYTDEQKEILKVRPGITDFASVEYFNENDILANSDDPEKTYIEEIMPAKIELNKKFITNPTLKNYFVIILKTILKLFKQGK